MRTAHLPVIASCLLSGVVALLVARPTAEPPAPTSLDALARLEQPPAPAETGEAPEAIVELRMQIALLEDRIAGLESSGVSGSREVPLAVANEPAGPGGSLAAASPAEQGAFRDQVTRVLEELEAEERAEQRAAEMEERAKEAADSYAEYDDVDARMEETVSKLGDQLGLGVQDRRVIRDLLEDQNDRNREMTRLWSSGDVDDEELGRIFMENRATHRAEVLELIGQERLGAYQGFLRAGGLGGRFSYFTAPWENWADAKAER
ncbi:MAG: hypothetical protein VX460_07145 [Planctomycetota bacterium]|nr:hypothetical protein [Planctomycetota bacterium]